MDGIFYLFLHFLMIERKAFYKSESNMLQAHLAAVFDSKNNTPRIDCYSFKSYIEVRNLCDDNLFIF